MMDEKAAPLQGHADRGVRHADARTASMPRRRRGQARPVPAPTSCRTAADPVIAISARAGLGVVAGQDIAAGERRNHHPDERADSQFVTGGQLRVHSGQAIGVLGGAVKAGEDNIGMQLIAAQGCDRMQAQGDTLNVQARERSISSAPTRISTGRRRRSISLSTAGGANITIEGGNITVQCPGKITIHAGKKSFSGPASMGADMPGAAERDDEIQ